MIHAGLYQTMVFPIEHYRPYGTIQNPTGSNKYKRNHRAPHVTVIKQTWSTGPYEAMLQRTVQAIQGKTGLYMIIWDQTGLHRIIRDSMEPYGTLYGTGNMRNYEGPYRTMRYPMGLYGIIQVHLGQCGIIWDPLESYGTPWDHTGPYGIKKDHTGQYRIIWEQMGPYGRPGKSFYPFWQRMVSTRFLLILLESFLVKVCQKCDKIGNN